METKCPKCEATDFSVIKNQDHTYCLVTCKNCGTVVGVLEDVDFKERFKTTIANQQGIDRHISMLESKIEDLEAEQKNIRDMIENTYSLVFNINKKIH